MDECVLRIDRYEGPPWRPFPVFAITIVFIIAIWYTLELYEPIKQVASYICTGLILAFSIVLPISLYQRNLHQRVILTNFGIIMPVSDDSRRTQTIDYMDIDSIHVSKFWSLTTIKHIHGKAQLQAYKFSSDAEYLACVVLLAAKYYECGSDEWDEL